VPVTDRLCAGRHDLYQPIRNRQADPDHLPRGHHGTVSHPTTSHDSNGNPIDSTAHELHCVDGSGQTVKEDPAVYAFLWLGIVAGGAMIVMAILAFILAAPAGVLIGRLRARRAQSRN
jgi:hypothetical protein